MGGGGRGRWWHSEQMEGCGPKALDLSELGSLGEWKNYQHDLSAVSNEEKMK